MAIGACLVLLLAGVNVASAQVVEGGGRSDRAETHAVRDTARIASVGAGPRAAAHIVPSHTERDAAAASTLAWGAAPVISGVVGAGAGAWLSAAMAQLGDRDAETRDYVYGAVIGAAVGASVGLLVQALLER